MDTSGAYSPILAGRAGRRDGSRAQIAAYHHRGAGGLPEDCPAL